MGRMRSTTTASCAGGNHLFALRLQCGLSQLLPLLDQAVVPIAPPPPPVPIGTTSCPYDCNAGFSNCARGWPAGKKAYCCRTANKGCEAPPPPPAPVVTTSLPYDCNAGYHNCYHCLIKQWSVGKLAWCCQHLQRGCPTTAAPR